MGKGKRTRIFTEEQRTIAVQKQLAEKRKKRCNTLVTVLVVAIVAVIGGGSVFGTLQYNKMVENGHFARKKNVISTKNYSANVCMMQYFFNSAVQNYVTNYGSYLSQLGLDNTKDLKTQTCYYDQDKTWYEYFMESAKTQMEQVLSLCEAAKEKGMTLSEADKKSIDSAMNTIKTSAEEKDQTVREYLDSTYGTWVSEQDMRDCMELTQLATKYQSEYESSLSYSDEKINSYFSENKDQFLTADYISYTVTSEATDKSSDAQKKVLNAAAKKKAESIAKAKNVTEFKKLLTEYLKDVAKKSDSSLKGDDLTSKAEELLSNATTTGASYNVTTDAGEWIFSDSRKIGDTKVLEDSQNGGYTVYCVTTPAKKDTSKTCNVRHILLSKDSYQSDAECEQAAKKLLKEWKNGKATEESFSDLAKEHSEDPGSASNGGLYENVPEGQMVTAFNDWIFDAKRAAGDTGLVKTDYGWHIMYYVSGGLPAWKSAVVTAMKNADYDKKLSDLTEKYAPKTTQKNLDLITQVIEESTDSSSEKSAS